MYLTDGKLYLVYSLSKLFVWHYDYKIKVYDFLKRLKYEYKNFDTWYDSLFDEYHNLVNGREIIIFEDITGVISGVAILKNTENEKKICTLRVGEQFQHQGIGSQLIEMSIKTLGIDKPMITINKSKFKQFKKLFDKYNFELTQTKRHYYGIFNTELVFNGTLPDKKLFDAFKYHKRK